MLEEPSLGESELAGGPECEQHRTELERREQNLQALARALVSETQAEENDSGWFVPWPERTAELVVGGVVAVLRKRVAEESQDPFVELAPALMAFVMAQYPVADANRDAKPIAAADELESQESQESRQSHESRLQRFPVRVTYRTTRVLSAIGDAPGLSNRDIAEIAGLADEGQTSRLLRRLEQRNLVRNVGVGHAHGGANAWLLTPYGQRVLDATRQSLVPGAGAVVGRRARGAG